MSSEESVKYRLGERLFPEPVFRVPRQWSNDELRKIGPLFTGDVVNVSSWQDQDKEGGFYSSYFPNAASYSRTNYEAGMRGFQGEEGEIFLDLTAPLAPEMRGRFDVVFNHTTLEHIYEFRTAFANVCAMSRDVVVIVLPWLQEQHADYGDYWRFSPSATAKLMAENGLVPARIRWNDHRRTSVYVFAVGVRDRSRWRQHFEFDIDPSSPTFGRLPKNVPGRRTLEESRISSLARRLINKLAD